MTMATLITKAVDKISGNPFHGSHSPSSGGTDSPHDRSIPPEPVQLNPHGDFKNQDKDAMLQTLNLGRANHGCKSLQWDEALAEEAETYARQLAEKGRGEQSSISSQGETLFVSTDDVGNEAAVDSWLRGEKDYDGKEISEGSLPGSGYYTQCMWHDTQRIGMGKAKAKDGTYYIVARYAPPGNIIGQMPF